MRVNHVDFFKNTLQYSTRIVNIKVSGPIELVGPENQVLNGGQISLYFNSKKEKGTAKITLTIDNIVKEITVPVK